jgi:tRNA dimethylallyltransferase
MEQNKKIILIAGPTASGKSELAIKIAQHLNSEVINADSMQIYKEISILNSSPNKEERKKIKHHMYGFNSVKKKFSTGHWLQLVEKSIKEQWNINKTPIVVGGTGLYFKALTEGLVKIPNIPTNFSQDIREMHERLGQENFFNELIKLDPLIKNFILPTDTQRSIRAYEVKKFTNESLSELVKKTKPNFNSKIFVKLYINFPKELLYGRIKKRVNKMFDEGAVEEVESFLKMKVYRELSSNKIIGIKEIRNYLNGKMTLIETKELIEQKTRQYAKRQFTWARGHMKSWKMIYSPNVNDLFKIAINKIS